MRREDARVAEEARKLMHSVCNNVISDGEILSRLSRTPGVALEADQGFSLLSILCGFRKPLTQKLLRVALDANPEAASCVNPDGFMDVPSGSTKRTADDPGEGSYQIIILI